MEICIILLNLDNNLIDMRRAYYWRVEDHVDSVTTFSSQSEIYGSS